MQWEGEKAEYKIMSVLCLQIHITQVFSGYKSSCSGLGLNNKGPAELHHSQRQWAISGDVLNELVNSPLYSSTSSPHHDRSGCPALSAAAGVSGPGWELQWEENQRELPRTGWIVSPRLEMDALFGAISLAFQNQLMFIFSQASLPMCCLGSLEGCKESTLATVSYVLWLPDLAFTLVWCSAHFICFFISCKSPSMH